MHGCEFLCQFFLHLMLQYKAKTQFYIKILVKTNIIICAFVHLHLIISREKFESEPGLELGSPELTYWQMAARRDNVISITLRQVE